MLYSYTPQASVMSMKLEDFGVLQARYQSMNLASRAAAVSQDAIPALDKAEDILSQLAELSQTIQACERIRQNINIVNKMRACEAKHILLDAHNDYIMITRRKLGAWRRTIERLSQGEDIIREHGREYVASNTPIAMAIAGVSNISSYLSMVQLIIMELVSMEPRMAPRLKEQLVEIRRSSTLLADYEHASGISQLVH